LVVTNYYSNTVSVLAGAGKDEFQTYTDLPAGAYPSAAAIADFNGDQIPDLAIADLEGNTVSVLLGEGGGKFASAVAYAAGFGPSAIAIRDFTGDNQPGLAGPRNGTRPIIFAGLKKGDGDSVSQGNSRQLQHS
jgi:hypothetical protein